MRLLSPRPLGAGSGPLPYGVHLNGVGVTYASLIPAIDFTNGSDDRNCSAPSANVTPSAAEELSSLSPSLLCLNGIDSGVISSTWQSNLSNATTFHNGSSTLRGCPPLPDETDCAFFASNRYTGNVSRWVDDVPTNSSEAWAPGLTGYLPTDIVYYLSLSFNASAVVGGVYSLSVDFLNATPIPVTFYVRLDPAGWTGSANVTVTFDLSAAWFTLLPVLGEPGQLAPGTSAFVSGYRLSARPPPCSTCAVIFTEFGLALGTEWRLRVSGQGRVSSTSQTATEPLPNGSYSFSVSSQNTSWAAPGGDFTVHGAVLPETVTFALLTFPIAFAETGLPVGTNWSVTLAGLPYYTRGADDAISRENGTYAFSVTAVAGYSVNRTSGTVSVNGAGVDVPLTFRSVPRSSASFLGLPASEGYALLGGVVVALVAAVAAVVVVRRRRGREPANDPTAPPPSPPRTGPP